MLLLKNGAVRYNPKNKAHELLLGDGTPENPGFIEREGRAVADYEAKNNKRIVDPARKFLTRIEFHKMLATNPAERATLDARTWKTKSFCTFTDTALLDALARSVKLNTEFRVKTALERAKTSGFERKVKSKSVKSPNVPAKAPEELNPPRSVPSPSKGPSKLPETQTANDDAIDVIAANYGHLKKRG